MDQATNLISSGRAFCNPEDANYKGESYLNKKLLDILSNVYDCILKMPPIQLVLQVGSRVFLIVRVVLLQLHSVRCSARMCG